MTEVRYVTADVFAEHRFGGNQLAVVLDGHLVPEPHLQAIAREFDYSETTFVLPPECGGTARVRIFTRADEAGFAGHPLVGTGLVLAERLGIDALELEVPAGIARVRVATQATAAGERRVATVASPAALEAAAPLDPALLACALGLDADAVVTATHAPTPCGMGREFVVAELTAEGLDAATPDLARFAAARSAVSRQRFSVLAYSWRGAEIACRMFSPLTGTPEDAATGSANVALAGLLLRCRPDRDHLRLTSRQGDAVGRPSRLELHAWRESDAIRASVAGSAIQVMRGTLAFE